VRRRAERRRRRLLRLRFGLRARERVALHLAPRREEEPLVVAQDGEELLGADDVPPTIRKIAVGHDNHLGRQACGGAHLAQGRLDERADGCAALWRLQQHAGERAQVLQARRHLHAHPQQSVARGHGVRARAHGVFGKGSSSSSRVAKYDGDLYNRAAGVT
jgi:hypothetical protein